jgi:hypothetical protein
MAQLLADFPNGVPQSEVNRVLDNQVAQGAPQHVVDAARTTFGADPVQNTRTILQGLFGNMDAQTALGQSRPPKGMADTGQGLQPYQGQPAGSSAPPTAAVTPSGAPITTGLPSWSSLLGSVGQHATPEQAAALGVAPGTMIDVPLLQRYRDQGLDKVVPGIGGRGGQGGAGQGGGQRGATPAGAPAPGSVFQPRTPGVQPGRNTPPEGSPLRKNPATGGGGATTPGTSTTLTPSPTTPPPPVPDTGLKPIVTGAPPGTEEDVKAWQAANAALPDQKRNITAGEAALEALQHAHAGPGTAASAKAKAFMIAQGIPGSGFIDSNDVMQRQIAQKNLLRFAQGNGGKVGTDLGLTTQLDSNANVDTMLNSTVDHILKRDLGMARQRMVMALAAPDRGTGKTEFGTGMGEHTRNFTPQTDPMAFAWDKLSPGERQAHLEQIKKVEGGEKKWERSMELARKYGAFQVPTAPAPAPAAAAPAPAPTAPTVVVRPQPPASRNALGY